MIDTGLAAVPLAVKVPRTVMRLPVATRTVVPAASVRDAPALMIVCGLALRSFD